MKKRGPKPKLLKREVIEKIVAMRAAGQTYGEIASWLNQNSHKTPRGLKFDSKRVFMLLKKEDSNLTSSESIKDYVKPSNEKSAQTLLDEGLKQISNELKDEGYLSANAELDQTLEEMLQAISAITRVKSLPNDIKMYVIESIIND